MRSCLYKLLAVLIFRCLEPFIEAAHSLPDEQHGFRRSRSTMSACRRLLDEIDRVLRRPRGALFAVFVDFQAAFDTAPRDRALQKLAAVGTPGNILGLLANILEPNVMILDDGITEHDELEQTTGFPQGDTLSPLLFSIVVSDLPQRVQQRHPFVKVLQYADDLVLYGESRYHLQQALATLRAYVRENELEINVGKTKAMKFRRGGRCKASKGSTSGHKRSRWSTPFRTWV